MEHSHNYMQLQPTFSIITITYNAVHLVEQTLLNVLSQSYPNIEYIVIDGGSTDGTVDIIDLIRIQKHILGIQLLS